jgi:hypothetical protein
VYIRAVQVVNHVKFETADFSPVKSDEEFFAGGDEAKPSKTDDAEAKLAEKFGTVEDALNDLDDDIPV